MNYFIFLIFLFSYFLKLFRCSHITKDDQILLDKNEYSYNVSNVKLNLVNMDADISEQSSSRIAYINDEEDEKIIFEIYTKYYNRLWMIVVNNGDKLLSLLEKYKKVKDEYSIIGFMIPNEVAKDYYDTIKKQDVPIFKMDEKTLNYYIDLDIRNMDSNLYFTFEIIRAVSTYPELYLLLVAIANIVISVGLITFWYVMIKLVGEAYIYPFHKFVKFIPFLDFLFSISLLVKAINIRGKDPNQDYDESIYVDTAMITLNSIYRTILWFYVLLICCGWQMSSQMLSREELKFFIKMFVFIYILMGIDQLLDSFDDTLWVFHYSEIKNVLFNFLMMVLFLVKQRKTENFLKRKLYYAITLSPEYIPGLAKKLSILSKLKCSYIFMPCFYIVVLVINKTLFSKIDTTVLEIFNYNYCYLVLLCSVVWIFRPQILPENFDVDLGNEIEGDEGNIYQYKIPNINEINSLLEKPSPKQINNCLENKNIPIVVIKPDFYLKDNNTLFINKYFSSIQIGKVFE